MSRWFSSLLLQHNGNDTIFENGWIDMGLDEGSQGYTEANEWINECTKICNYVEIENVKIMNKFSYFPFIIMIIMKFYLNMNIYAC